VGRISIVAYAVAMIVLILVVDFALLRNHSTERLIVNVGIVLVFGLVYVIFLK
jgi:hypothetical protein